MILVRAWVLILAAALASMVLVVWNAAAEARPSKLDVCHNGHTINISERAWPAHERHGDTRGDCEESGNPGGECTIESLPVSVTDPTTGTDPDPNNVSVGETLTIALEADFDFGTDWFITIEGAASEATLNEDNADIEVTETGLVLTVTSPLAVNLGEENLNVADSNIDCFQIPVIPLSGTVKETRDGSTALVTNDGKAVKLTGKDKKSEVALKRAVNKPVKVQGVKKGSTVEVKSFVKADKKR